MVESWHRFGTRIAIGEFLIRDWFRYVRRVASDSQNQQEHAHSRGEGLRELDFVEVVVVGAKARGPSRACPASSDFAGLAVDDGALSVAMCQHRARTQVPGSSAFGMSPQWLSRLDSSGKAAVAGSPRRSVPDRWR
jgi:hypothetical protein